MKRLLSVLICLVMILSPVFSLAEDLSESEQQYLGSWAMYMVEGKTTYLFTITFFDDLQVVMKSLQFSGSTLVSDHKASGKWCGFTSNMIVLSLAGNDFTGGIREDGLFGLYDFTTHEASGFFSRVPDLSYMMTSSEEK